MSGKRFCGGLVVFALIAGMSTEAAMAFQRGRGAARGRSGASPARAASRNLPTTPSIPGVGNAVSSPIRRGVPTLAPAKHELGLTSGRDTVSEQFNGRQFRDRANLQQPAQSVLDHLGADSPSDLPRPGAFNGGNLAPSAYQPFTPAWYAEHPQAWQMTHPHADAAAVATSTAVAVWLGASHVQIDASTTTSNETTSDAPVAEPATPTPDMPQIADDGQWLPLGSFELRLSGQTVATRAIQLAVNRQGVIRGTYYDMAADSAKQIIGSVDKETLRASWTIGQSGQVVYEMSLEALSSPEGQLTVRYANGQTATWRTSPVSR
ncbi:MAG TPA: hypothetical protein VE890_07960 [Thermoguttaceae bacterium]|nr:hypothetical protein [Thermoguttaceae bacterium]